MIGVIFQLGNEMAEVRIIQNDLCFRTSTWGAQFVPIEALKIDYNGTIREFPDLKDNEEWKQIAIQRMKDKIKSLKTEQQKANYIIEDLKKFGYIPLYLQKEGFRPIKL